MELTELERRSLDDLRLPWRNNWGRLAPAHLSRALLFRVMAYRLQAEAFGDLDRKIIRLLDRLADDQARKSAGNGSATQGSERHAESKVSSARTAFELLILKLGALLIREWQGRLERVTVCDDGFAWNGATYGSVSAAAFAITGTSGTAIGFSACDGEMTSAWASVRMLRKELMDAKGRAYCRAASRSADLSRSAINRRHR